MKKKSSLSVKTLYYLSVFSILILFLLWILQIQFLNFFYERYQIENIKTIAKNIKSEEDLEEGTVEELAYRYDICIQYETETKEEIKVVEINTKNPQCILGQKNKQIENYKADLVKSNQDYIKLFKHLK